MNTTTTAQSFTLNMMSFNVDHDEKAIVEVYDDASGAQVATITIDWSKSGTNQITVEHVQDISRHVALVITQEASDMLDSFFDPDREPITSLTLGF